MNTLHKFSESISASSTLTELYWARWAEKEQRREKERREAATMAQQQQDLQQQTLEGDARSAGAGIGGGPVISASSSLQDQAVALIASFSASLPPAVEDSLIDSAFTPGSPTLVLAKHYHADPQRFLRHAMRQLHLPFQPSQTHAEGHEVVVIGGGLAGFTVALSLLADHPAARVTMLEKESFFGGNSAKASSGVNGVHHAEDSAAIFLADVVASGGTRLVGFSAV